MISKKEYQRRLAEGVVEKPQPYPPETAKKKPVKKEIFLSPFLTAHDYNGVRDYFVVYNRFDNRHNAVYRDVSVAELISELELDTFDINTAILRLGVREVYDRNKMHFTHDDMFVFGYEDEDENVFIDIGMNVHDRIKTMLEEDGYDEKDFDDVEIFIYHGKHQMKVI